ncbi:hypothetical protein VNO78_09417 [Psophocarpus tetragonolobus]|uniref:Uncharacterized protein n=1 Tax=Psophocarpus tetragonolobus TaxID=3891 RepID=A0AAN9XT72_PSOTE
MRYLQASMEHMQLQQSFNHRGIVHLYQGLYQSIPAEQQNPWMAQYQFSSYLAWLGDRYFFPRGSGVAGADYTSGAARPNYAGDGYDGRSSRTAADFVAKKVLGAPFQNEDFDKDLDRVMKGD